MSQLQFSKIIGSGASSISVITSCLASACVFFFIYAIGNIFQLKIYPFYNRITVYTNFNVPVIDRGFDNVILTSLFLIWLFISLKNKNLKVIAIAILGPCIVLSTTFNSFVVLDILALASLPTIVSLTAYNRFKSSGRLLRQDHSKLTINYLSILLVSFGIISIIMHLAGIISSSPIMTDHMYNLYLVISSFSPYLMLIVVASFPVRIVISLIHKRIIDNYKEEYSKEIRKRSIAIILVSMMGLSIALTQIPHLENVNASKIQIGVDTGYYFSWAKELESVKDGSEFLAKVFVEQGNGDRPLSILFVFLLTLFFNLDLIGLEVIIPTILGPLLVMSVFYLTKQLTSNNITALLASFFTVVSFHTLIGIYAGFYANWIALIFGYLALTFAIRFLKLPDKKTFIIFMILMFGLLLAHVYTWSIFAAVMLIFSIYALKKNLYQRRNIILIISIILLTIGIDVSKMIVSDSRSGFEADLEIAGNQTGLNEFYLRWNNLFYTVTTFVGGHYSNFLILGLCVLWTVYSRYSDLSTIVITIFLTIGIIPIIFGDPVVQTRILYNIPFQIPAAIVLTKIMRTSEGKMIASFICVWLIAIAIRSLYNYPLLS